MRSLWRIARAGALLYPALPLGLAALLPRRPFRRGLPGLAAVFAPYLFLPLALLLPAARRRDARALRALLLACGIIYLRRFTPAVCSPRRAAPRRAGSGGARFSVLSWNYLFSNPRVDDLLPLLRSTPADMVALQELTPEHVARIAGDPALRQRYPYQVVWPYGRGAGMGLLSCYPIRDQGALTHPPTIWAQIDFGGGRGMTLASAHPTFFPPLMAPERPDVSWGARLRRIFDPRFLRYDPDHRDRGIARVRALIDPLLRQGAALLVVGDFNVTEREPAYRELTAELQDAQPVAGRGIGLTWRPEWLAHWPVPILRIDYMLCSARVRPLRLEVDRTPRGSDHCILRGVFEL